MSGVNKFSGEGQARLRFFSYIIGPLPKKKVAPVGKVTPSKDCKRGTNLLDNMEDPVVKTCGKDLDNFQGKSTASIGWFNIYHEWLKTFSTI